MEFLYSFWVISLSLVLRLAIFFLSQAPGMTSVILQFQEVSKLSSILNLAKQQKIGAQKMKINGDLLDNQVSLNYLKKP